MPAPAGYIPEVATPTAVSGAPAGYVPEQLPADVKITPKTPDDNAFDAISGFLRGAASVVPGVVEGIHHPLNALSDLWETHKEQFRKAAASGRAGDLEGAAQHVAGGLLPVFGPMASDFLDSVSDPNVDNAELAHKLGQIVGGKALVDNAGLAKKLGPAAEALRYADPAKDLSEVYKPSDPRFPERAPMAIADIKKNAPVKITSNEHLASTSPDQVVTPALKENRAAMQGWHQPVQNAGITGTPTNILTATRESVKSMADPVRRQAIVDEAAHQLAQEPLTPDRLKSLLEEKNGELSGFYSKDPGIQEAAKQAGALTGRSQALLEAQAKALRNEYYNLLDPKNGGAGPREIQRRYGAIKMLQDEASNGPTRNRILAETKGTPISKGATSLLNTANVIAGPLREGGIAEGLKSVKEPFTGTSDPLIERAFRNAPDAAPLPQAPPLQQRYP